MPTAIRSLALFLLAAALGAPAAFAQHAHGGSHGASQGTSPYAGQQSRDIKSLSAAEVKDLLDGAGMGFAKAAELNRYPGPSHALEHAAAMHLSPAQRASLESLLHRHKAEARALGKEVVDLERELDRLFAGGRADAEGVERVLARWGEAMGRLRASHLKTHLETTALLTPEQVDRYVQLRGYADGAATGHRH